MKDEICQNCGCTIGKLERAYVFNGKVVCQNCYQKLTNTEDKQPQTETKEKAGAKSNKFLVVCGLILIILVAWFALSLVVKLVIRQDPSNSLQSLIDNANKGDPNAQFFLGKMYSDGKDYKEAFKWYTKAAEQGYTYAQVALGLIYQEGKGVIEDNKEAIKWFTMAAEKGDAHAQFFLGVIYYNGKGVRQDYEEAIKWFTMAAEKGNAHAQSFLGDMYYYGEGVRQDYEEAYKWVLLAQMNGLDVPLKEKLDSTMVPIQIAEAQKLAKKFVEKQEKEKSKKDTSVSGPE